MQQKLPELLAPAGSLLKAKIALLYGADAIYCSIPAFGMRAPSSFSYDDIISASSLAHSLNKKIYITLNSYTHEGLFSLLPNALRKIAFEVKPDGMIIADLGVASIAHKIIPEIPIHVSTQANLVNSEACHVWKEVFGATRVILSRELKAHEVKKLRENVPDMEMEIFVHGAQCMAISGRCLISNYLTGRGANQGACAQSCRWNYKIRDVQSIIHDPTPDLNLNTFTSGEQLAVELDEEKRPNEWMRVEEYDEGTYFFNALDQCQLGRLNDVLAIGLDSLKIEGRNRSEFYVATVTRAWRLALDGIWTPEQAFHEVNTIESRGLCSGFFGDEEIGKGIDLQKTKHEATYIAAGRITENGFLVSNRLDTGDNIIFLAPDGRNIEIHLDKLEKISGEIILSAHGGANTYLKIPTECEGLPIGTIARTIKD